MFVFNAAVLGAGTMGGKIAHTIANAEIPVVLKDVDQKFADLDLEKASSLWQARVDAGKLEASEVDRMLSLITGAIHHDGFGDVDFVIEAVPERMEIKQVSGAGDIDAGIEAEKRAFATVFASEDAREGISAFLHKCPPRFQGK
jgi:3-hydroxyacyl-CoA dehydrogenase